MPVKKGGRRQRPDAAALPAVPFENGPLATRPQLLYVHDGDAGIRRERSGEAWIYFQPNGKRLTDAAQVDRIRRLAIPPAYTDVWICTSPQGHLQATGRDARGRKQYRYHADWRLARDADKFEHMLAFGGALPRIRRRVANDLALPVSSHPSRTSVLAALVRLLDTTLVRIGNDEYARTNRSYGLTTLRNRHVDVNGTTMRLHFRGKSGVQHDVALQDPRVARIVRRCQAMPGQELFQYEDADGQRHRVDSGDVNGYLADIGGGHFTAKDFRTWHASVHALTLLLDVPEPATSASMRRRTANELLAEVAARLGNTVAVCRKSYVHPRVLQAALEGLPATETTARPRERKRPAAAHGITAEERRLLAFLADQPEMPTNGKSSPRKRAAIDAIATPAAVPASKPARSARGRSTRQVSP